MTTPEPRRKSKLARAGHPAHRPVDPPPKDETTSQDDGRTVDRGEVDRAVEREDGRQDDGGRVDVNDVSGEPEVPGEVDQAGQGDGQVTVESGQDDVEVEVERPPAVTPAAPARTQPTAGLAAVLTGAARKSRRPRWSAHTRNVRSMLLTWVAARERLAERQADVETTLASGKADWQQLAEIVGDVAARTGVPAEELAAVLGRQLQPKRRRRPDS
ncbi:MAG: hypothetical protein HOV94_39160 [Saccharothrix sp.]|nr:hypothetical protein [Saccharothrix sp.]